MGEVVIRVEDLKKKYCLGGIDAGTFRGDVRRWLDRKKGLPKEELGQKNQEFWALKGISFDVEKGETLGVIGANGAGKSTFLKILSRVTEPMEGTVKVRGRIASMLEVGTGFHGELTGRENCYLNGAICGMSRAEIAERMEEIIDFSEIGAFIDTPVKRYSSGMYVKLAFSVAAHLNADILIMDEVLAVGDLAFQNKCLEKMRCLAREEGRTVLYVSHNMTTIRSLCSRCIVLENGRLVFHGETDEAVQRYAGLKREGTAGTCARREPGEGQAGKDAYLGGCVLSHTREGRIYAGESLSMGLTCFLKEPVRGPRIRCTFQDRFGNNVATGFSGKGEALTPAGQRETEILVHSEALAPGEYDCSVALFVTDVRGGYVELDVWEKVFSILVEEREFGLSDCRWDALHHGQVRLLDIEEVGRDGG